MRLKELHILSFKAQEGMKRALDRLILWLSSVRWKGRCALITVLLVWTHRVAGAGRAPGACLIQAQAEPPRVGCPGPHPGGF